MGIESESLFLGLHAVFRATRDANERAKQHTYLKRKSAADNGNRRFGHESLQKLVSFLNFTAKWILSLNIGYVSKTRRMLLSGKRGFPWLSLQSAGHVWFVEGRVKRKARERERPAYDEKTMAHRKRVERPREKSGLTLDWLTNYRLCSFCWNWHVTKTRFSQWNKEFVMKLQKLLL